MLDRNIDKVERIIELTSNSGKKEQFRVGDVVDINYRKPFDPRGVGYNGDAGLTGRIADIKDAQESTRYCNYNKSGDVAFIRPVFFAEDTPEMDNWVDSCMRAEKTYNYLISEGRTPQEARSVLPNSLKTEVVMTANLREWRHFLSLRACGSTGKPHPQMLEVTVPLLKELRERVPVVFDDLEPMEWETVK